MDATLEITIDDGSGTGNGYTMLEKTGNALPYGMVSAYMDSTQDYFINFTLGSGADFLTIEGGLA